MNNIIRHEDDLKKIDNLLNALRDRFNLPPKKHTSNFIFNDEQLEIAHILRMGCDDMFEEIKERKYSQATDIAFYNN